MPQARALASAEEPTTQCSVAQRTEYGQSALTIASRGERNSSATTSTSMFAEHDTHVALGSARPASEPLDLSGLPFWEEPAVAPSLSLSLSLSLALSLALEDVGRACVPVAAPPSTRLLPALLLVDLSRAPRPNLLWKSCSLHASTVLQEGQREMTS